MEKKYETIDMTPTWEGLLRWYLEIYENGDREGRKTALQELTRMAKIADLYVEEKKIEIKKTTPKND